MSFATPVDLYHVVRRAWAPETIASPFDPANPARNQCAVTALAVRHHFGGDIVTTPTKGGTHFYNHVDSAYWDLSADQFDEPIPYENRPSSVAEAHEHASPAELAALLANIDALR